MIVYYIAEDEHPSKTTNVRFYSDEKQAFDAAVDNQLFSYSFEVNEKYDINVFGMETIVVLRKDFVTGEYKFFASGLWLELHNALNIPFYQDFETSSKSFIAMSLRYFNEHYSISLNKKEKSDENLVDPRSPEVDEDVLGELFSDVLPEQNQNNLDDLQKILL